ncbi:MAG: chloride channel protein [Cytophagales bacterium]|nr:chloride channel protein [Cytophagales bacterium]
MPRFRKIIMKLLIWRLKYVSDNNFLIIIASAVGLVAGLAAVILKSTVHEISRWLDLYLNKYEVNYLYLGLPILGILLTVVLAKYIFRENMGHGITDILYSISKNSSIIRKTKTYSRMVTSALTVGFGGSVGLEAPIVLTGSAIGSNLSRLVHLDYKSRTLLIGCGAAGAIASIFNSPVAGMIFAMEVILTEVTVAQFIPILIASVGGQLVSMMLLGEDILFSFTLTDQFKTSDTLPFAALGIVCGLASIYFVKTIKGVEGMLHKLQNTFGRVAIGGLALALIILTFPPLFGEGYESIKFLLSGQETAIFERSFFYSLSDNSTAIIAFVALIIITKPIATALTLGSGGSGGIFAPSLFMGGMVGFLFARVANTFYSALDLSESNFTLVGMCGVMSGVQYAPLTAIFLIAEITSGYELFVPLMVVSALSYSTVSYFEKHSIYTKGLIEKGDLIRHDKDKQVLSLINLKKIIETDLLTISPDAKLDDLVGLVKKSKRNIFPVVNDEGILEGIVSLDQIRDIMFDDEMRRKVEIRALMQMPPTSVSLQEKMQSVMNKFEMTQAWNLPVLDEGKYHGFISKSRIFNAYRTKLKRQSKQ